MNDEPDEVQQVAASFMAVAYDEQFYPELLEPIGDETPIS